MSSSALLGANVLIIPGFYTWFGNLYGMGLAKAAAFAYEGEWPDTSSQLRISARPCPPFALPLDEQSFLGLLSSDPLSSLFVLGY